MPNALVVKLDITMGEPESAGQRHFVKKGSHCTVLAA